MDTDAILALIQTHLHQQCLVPRAIDAAADALRHWYSTTAQSLPLDMLALYPHSWAIDLSTAHESHTLTRIDIGVPDGRRGRHGDFVDVGTFWFETDLNGSITTTTLTIDTTQLARDRWIPCYAAADLTLVLPPVYAVNAHGSTLIRTIWHAPTPDAHIPASLVATLRWALDIDGRVALAHAEGHRVFTLHGDAQPTNDQGWISDAMMLDTTQVQLVFPLDAGNPPHVAVMLAVRGRPDMLLGHYHFWTALDGTYVDDYSTLERKAGVPPAADPPPEDIPADIRIDLGELSPKRYNTLRRLIAVVGLDGLHRLMAEARTRVAEQALWNPDPMTPKSVRSMLWQMLEQGALDANARAFVLGLQKPK